MKIGEFILKHMNEKQISQAELARRSGVPASTISSIIIRNNDRVAIEMMLKICDVLECDIEEYIDSLKNDKPKRMPDLFAKKYYALDKFGQNTVNVVLESEYKRCTSEENQKPIYISRVAARNGDPPGERIRTQEELDEIRSRPDADPDL